MRGGAAGRFGDGNTSDRPRALCPSIYVGGLYLGLPEQQGDHLVDERPALEDVGSVEVREDLVIGNRGSSEDRRPDAGHTAMGPADLDADTTLLRSSWRGYCMPVIVVGKLEQPPRSSGNPVAPDGPSRSIGSARAQAPIPVAATGAFSKEEK
jgi:hypothetical protein